MEQPVGPDGQLTSHTNRHSRMGGRRLRRRLEKKKNNNTLSDVIFTFKKKNLYDFE